MDRYGPKDRGIIYEGSGKVLQMLRDLDFYQMSQDAKVTKNITAESSLIDWQEYTNTALVPANTTQKSS